MWQHAADPSVMLPISMFRMNCSFSFRSASAASIISSPACAVNVIFSASILTILSSAFMSTMVPGDETQGVSE